MVYALAKQSVNRMLISKGVQNEKKNIVFRFSHVLLDLRVVNARFLR